MISMSKSTFKCQLLTHCSHVKFFWDDLGENIESNWVERTDKETWCQLLAVFLTVAYLVSRNALGWSILTQETHCDCIDSDVWHQPEQ